MGIVHRGIPAQAATKLRQRHHLEIFIETGTHVGKTAVWASGQFTTVITIESVKHYYDIARGRLSDLPNVVMRLGSSEALLPAIVHGLTVPAMFWLDAHWSRDLKGKKPDTVCPVMAELAAINSSTWPHMVLIDDARLFGSTPGWPSLDEVKTEAGKNGRTVWVADDVVFAVPQRIGT